MSHEAYHETKKSLVIWVDELAEHLTRRYQELWEPYHNIVVDKSLIPTKACCMI